MRRHHQHAEPDAQLARDGRQDRNIAAVRVRQNQLAQSGAIDALADFDQYTLQRLGRKT